LNVAICVATYRRPAQLAVLLDALSRLDTTTVGAVMLAIADNDAAASARTVVDAARERLPFAIAYDVAPEPNISLARNASVRLALREGAQWLAFIDDDEAPRPDWLAALVRVQRESRADVVAGPVIGRPPANAPRWMRRAFTRDRDVPSGTIVPLAETSNALVSRAVVERVIAATGGPFEPQFGRSGGGDTRFFLRARLGGARMVWAADAVVEEDVPPSRARLGWLMRRAFREGNAGAFVERGIVPRMHATARRIAAAGAHVVFGIVLLPIAPLRALRYLAHAIGSIAGTLGFRYFEYR
jgi:GT2 family glycosyltransferase